jgi:glycosyltransferase involved in cell wall biosynthesis
MRRLLVVSYYYPPCPGIGGVRWAAMAHYLQALGYSVTVATSNVWGSLPNDAADGVTRIGDLRTSRIARTLLDRFDLPVAGYVPDRPPPGWVTKVVVPEPKTVTWLPFAMPVVRRLVGRDQVDCLVTTSPAESSHLVGLLLGKRRPAWVADFRDGWTFEPLRERFPTAPQRWLDSSFERRVARTANAVVGATRPITHDLSGRLGANSTFVPSGWDPLDAPAASTPDGGGEDCVRLVYTGTMAVRRDPRPMFEALRAVNSASGRRPVRLVYAGRLTDEHQAMIAKSNVASFVEDLGMLDRAAAIDLQHSADALVLLTSRNASEATGKIYEYLASGRPIVALAEGNEAARIVRETNTGITVPPDDVDAIVGAFRRVATGELAEAYAPKDLDRYTYPGPAEAMAEVIEEAIARRSVSRG